MSELLPCPFCGGKGRTQLSMYNGLWYVYCQDKEEHNVGHFSGEGYYDTEQDAIEAWNTRTQPPAQALTIEQLKERDGCPVWLDTGGVAIGEQVCGHYEILDHITSDLIDVFWFTRRVRGFLSEDYGVTWLCYDRQPEKGE